ncbi:PAS domain S-box protein [Mucilaginibacter terrenus]|uniref:histidine kinase n=1 Tax=Mucilaginibacter terrenus TaxID=2482727 RepID=A0A3E2NJ79_9SPHI|nr:ATP-binding protein [Mucilaginibacter terrenus]RFZ81039.1 PAS domain S-box protein [Mucilaginibacter terrenus]
MSSQNQPLIPVEEQFKIIADTAPVLIWISGVDKLCYFFNTGWLNFTGRSMQQEVGTGWTEGVHPDDLQRCLKTYFHAFDAREEFRIEYRLKRHDGRFCWVIDHGVPRYTQDGEFAGYIGSCINIDSVLESERVKTDFISSESVKNEQALNEELASTNEELTAANEELASINMQLVSAQGKLAALNSQLEEKVLLRTAELEQSEQEQQALNEELAATNEELTAANDGLVISQEQLQNTIRELAESEHQIRSLVESAPFPIGVYKGREMRIILANQSIMDVWGKGNDVVGKLYSEILPELSNQQIYSQLDDVYTTGVPFHARNQRVDIVVDGKLQPYYFNYSFTPLYDTAGNIYGVMNTAAEVTDLVLAKQRVEQSERQLEQSLEDVHKLQRQKDGFIGIASHELKTPLTSLSAIIQVLTAKLKDSTDPFISGGLSKATAQVKKMSNLINGFLNISRLESGKILIEKQQFRLDQLLDDVIDEVQLTTQNHQISHLSRQPINVFADKEKIGSVLANLLSNAIKYSPKGRQIDVSYEVQNNIVKVAIRDEGMGIKQQDLDKLFDRYYRVESNHTRHISGFGIGLYLSAEIIKQHDGEIWAESESGVGSTFYFTLPLN